MSWIILLILFIMRQGVINMQIGYIGTGVMGSGVISNLLQHGEAVKVFNRTKVHAQAVLNRGQPGSVVQQN